MWSSSDGRRIGISLLMGGGGAFLFFVVLRRIIFQRHSKNDEAGKKRSVGEASSSLLLHQQTRAAQTVPVEVIAKKLSDGWAVAPPIFYPPHLAVIPILRPKTPNEAMTEEGGDFIMCDGSLMHAAKRLKGAESLESFYTQYLQNMPLLQSVARGEEAAIAVQPLDSLGFSCESGCFTHIAAIPGEKMIIAFGHNGPYVISLYLTQYEPSLTKEKKNGTERDHLNSGDAQMLLDACQLVPLIDGVRLPGAPLGAKEGFLRLTLRHKNHMIMFTLLSSLSVRKNASKKENENGKAGTSFAIVGDVLPGGELIIGNDDLDALVKGTPVDTIFPLDTNRLEGGPLVSSLLSQIVVESINDPVLNEAGVRVASPRQEDDLVSVVFSHAPLGVSFSVNPRTGVICEPTLTDDLLVWYYPLGSDDCNSLHSEEIPRASSPPRVSIRRLTQLPPTWEKFFSTEDELKHNVLFHFTDWAREQVPCSICDINGLRGVRIFEEKEGYSCRSYVIPRANTILVVRWETETREWNKHLPLLQKFLDTLHIVYSSE